MRRPTRILVSVGLAITLISCNSDDRQFIVDYDRVECTNTTHATIQEAVNEAIAGETILVCPGLYTERVVVPATHNGLTLQGEGGLAANRTGDPRTEAVLEGSGLGEAALVVQTSGVTIEGFTVRNTPGTGIEILGQTDVVLHGITITGNYLMAIGDPNTPTVQCINGRGINIEEAIEVSVENNVILSPCDAGIRFNAVTASTIRNNSIDGSRKRPGIAIRGASMGNLITGNNSQNNRESGISLQDSTGNTVDTNMMRNNGVPGAPLRSIPGPGSNTDADDTTNLPLTNPPDNTWRNNDCRTENRQGLCTS